MRYLWRQLAMEVKHVELQSPQEDHVVQKLELKLFEKSQKSAKKKSLKGFGEVPANILFYKIFLFTVYT